MEDQKEVKKPISNGYIIGINVGILAVYTIISKATAGGMLIDAFFILIQFLVCIITGAAVRRWVWVLSAFVVVLIGFSTCIELMGNTL
jgi:hypothetical protein